MDDSNVTYGTIEFHQTENKLLKATARIASLEAQLEKAEKVIEKKKPQRAIPNG